MKQPCTIEFSGYSPSKGGRRNPSNHGEDNAESGTHTFSGRKGLRDFRTVSDRAMQRVPQNVLT